MKLRLALFVGLSVIAWPLSARSSNESTPDHLVEAIKLADAIKPEQTEYRHRPSVVHWPGDPGGAECRTDCSGFVDLLLRHSYEWAGRDWLEKQTGKKRPLAGDLYRAIQAHHGFSAIKHVADVEPGDFIVMKYPVDSDNTGHVMLIEKAPHERSATEPIQEGTKQWDVAVIDETSSPHGTSDSRYIGKGVKNGGLGRGTFRLYTSSDGTFAGYTWSPAKTNKFYGPDTRPLVVARLSRSSS